MISSPADKVAKNVNESTKKTFREFLDNI